MTIRVRGKSFQVDFVQGGQRYRRDYKTYQDASEAEVKAKARLLEGLDPFPRQALETKSVGKTFGESSEEVWNLEWSKGASPLIKLEVDSTLFRWILVGILY